MAPTGSGKTLAAFLVGLDSLVRARARRPRSTTRCAIVYVSPLKALGDDVEATCRRRSREHRGDGAAARAGCCRRSARRCAPATPRRPSAREIAEAAAAHPHHHARVALPLLTVGGGPRDRCASVRDRDRRRDPRAGAATSAARTWRSRSSGSTRSCGGAAAAHRALGDAWSRSTEAARFLVGRDAARGGARPCRLVDAGRTRRARLASRCPKDDARRRRARTSLGDIYERLVALVAEHRTTLVFVQHAAAWPSAWRTTSSERLGEDAGRRPPRQRSPSATRLASRSGSRPGSCKAVVATASLELGIDIGDVDLVVSARLAALDRGVAASASAAPATRRRHAQGAHLRA